MSHLTRYFNARSYTVVANDLMNTLVMNTAQSASHQLSGRP
jgi:hypothetical protein